MIREERNALFLLLAFTIAAGLLYFFILRPALTEATSAQQARIERVSDRVEAKDVRPRAVRRMLSVTGVIRGSVTGAPLSDADVSILDISDIADPAIVIDDQGVLTIDFLPPEISFGLRVSCDDHEPRTFRQLRGAARETLDLGLITLKPIRRLEGVVRDHDGQPVNDAIVTLFPVDTTGTWTDPFERAATLAQAMVSGATATGRTSVDGSFTISDLEPSRFAAYVVGQPTGSVLVPIIDLRLRDRRITVRMKKGPAVRGQVDVHDGDLLRSGTVVLLEAGSLVSGELSAAYCRTANNGEFAHYALESVPHFVFITGAQAAASGCGPYIFVPGSVLALSVGQGVDARGTILDAERLPVPDALVTAHSEANGSITIGTRSNEDGTFVIRGLHPGPARLLISADRQPPQRALFGHADSPEEIRVQLNPPGSLRGTVHCDGLPLVGARVTCEQPHRSVVTDLEGRYQLDNLPAGALRVFAVAAGHALTEKRVEIRLRDENRLDFGLERGGSIRIQTLGSSGLPLSGATVRALSIESEDRIASHPPWVVLTDDGGFARVQGLPAGQRVVLFASSVRHAPVRSEPLEVTIERGSVGVALTLRESARLDGHVRDGAGKPLPLVRVRAIATHDRVFDQLLLSLADMDVRTDAEGRFSITSLPSGTYRVLAERSDSSSVITEEIVVNSGDTISDLELTLLPGAMVEGVVVDASDRPVAAATVRLMTPESPTLPALAPQSMITDAAGRFRFARPISSPFILIAESAGSGRIELLIESEPGPYRLALEAP